MPTRFSRESGFTLIELLTIIGIIGVLASIALVNYSLYKVKATRSVVAQTRADARVALEAGTVDPATLPALTSATQSDPGPISDPQGALLLPGFQLPQRFLISYFYDRDCSNDACIQASLAVLSCKYKVYNTWVRTGDGMELSTEGTAAGAPC